MTTITEAARRIIAEHGPDPLTTCDRALSAARAATTETDREEHARIARRALEELRREVERLGGIPAGDLAELRTTVWRLEARCTGLERNTADVRTRGPRA